MSEFPDVIENKIQRHVLNRLSKQEKFVDYGSQNFEKQLLHLQQELNDSRNKDSLLILETMINPPSKKDLRQWKFFKWLSLKTTKNGCKVVSANRFTILFT